MSPKVGVVRHLLVESDKEVLFVVDMVKFDKGYAGKGLVPPHNSYGWLKPCTIRTMYRCRHAQVQPKGRIHEFQAGPQTLVSDRQPSAMSPLSALSSLDDERRRMPLVKLERLSFDL